MPYSGLISVKRQRKNSERKPRQGNYDNLSVFLGGVGLALDRLVRFDIFLQRGLPCKQKHIAT